MWLYSIIGQPTQHFADRFWAKVQLGYDDDCWNWTACISHKGYGQFQVRKSRPGHAHRVAYCLSVRDVPATTLICHNCDNRLCCNPNHLFEGTPLSNMQDMIKKGRYKDWAAVREELSWERGKGVKA